MTNQSFTARGFRTLLMRTFLAAAIVALPIASSPAQTTSSEQLAFFESKIRPVLAEHCYSCHSASAKEKGKLKADLFVDSREGLLNGGETGTALVAGKPGESLMLKVLKHQIKDVEMPPKGKLPDKIIADVEQWIAMGAPDPRIATDPVSKPKRVIDVVKGKEWWAFQPLNKVAVPQVKNAAVKTPIDNFIIAKQETAGLVPNAVATKEKLLRRVTFDLIGMAPTPEQRNAFLQDTSADAYTKLIDRLLTSERYGERWGRHWLDVVRYAESGGYEFDGFRPGAYHYRDWVIKALNKDMPYDQFIRMQLAGDKLMPGEYEGASASGFLVAGPYPGQTTAKTLEKIRYDQLDDMVSTIGNGFLGLTIACVRCHDHKYDPLPQSDYYGIAAALATTVHGPVQIDLGYAETQKKLAEFNKVGAPLHAALKKFESEELPKRFETWKSKELPKLQSNSPWQVFDVQEASAQKAKLIHDHDGHVIYTGGKEKDDVYTIKVVTHQQGVRAFRLDALSDKSLPKKGPGLSDNGNFVLGDVQITARPLDAKKKVKPTKLDLKPGAVSFEQKRFEFAQALDNSPQTGWGVAPEMGKDHAAIFEVEGEPVGFKEGTEFEIQLRFARFYGLGKLRLSFTSNADAKLDDAKDMQNLRELNALIAAKTEPKDMVPWFSRFDEQAQKLLTAVTEHERKRPLAATMEVYSTKDGGQDVYLLRRGEVDRKEGKAAPNFIQVLMRSPDAEKKWVPQTEPVHPRISLANWMTDAQAGGGPLLARVIVNRLWRLHFGRGLVPTTNDFGSQGEQPTHRELLDYLANELVNNGWRLKPIHRLIMLSNVYTQSGDVNPSNAKLDPENHLWAQRPARRLEAEAIRDALLQMGSKLDPTMYGPSETNNQSGRRSVYLRVKRSELEPFMTMFDAPEPTQSIGDRGNTTVPTQALAVMNSPFVHDLATKMLARIQATKPANTEAIIRQAYALTFARDPEPEETARMKSFIEQQTKLLGNKPDAANQALREFCHALLCLNEFIYVD